ncbi:tetraacyldisaccharide 4'-kinase [Hyphomonas sp.]|uniref:tetraacyldisaccharide 4'-kinase n=1 Tax=Hyphomonas sp. TaxID=87 RepID=UPI0025C5FD0B|nr:tetraacyldisaccharide 4'-kinase [Hyphomonas sp.]
MKPPYFWSAGLDPRSREAAPLTRALLTPLAALYTWGIRLKLARAEPPRASIPVICVGNLTVGGVGKTPIVQALRQHIDEKDLQAASLSRGYGGSEISPQKVYPDWHTADMCGDEPLLLAQTGESWIGRDRFAGVQLMSSNGVDVVVMDDGHQNPGVHKDLSLVVIDAAAPFGNGHVLPKGPLREPVTDGLARADAVILMGEGDVPQHVRRSGLPVLRARIVPAAPPPEGPLVAFAGIGRPQKFFDSLAASGGDVRDTVDFPDHHVFSKGDLTHLRRLAEDHGARLITTSKDHVRLQPGDRADILHFPVKAEFEDSHQLDALLNPILYPQDS